MTISIEPQDIDFEVAFSRRFMGGAAAWASMKHAARKAAAERLIKANREAQAASSLALLTLKGDEWIAEQERFLALVEEHDELVRVAFPDSEGVTRV